MGISGGALANVAKGVFKKGAEGLANWMLMRRIGNRATQLFRPIREKSGRQVLEKSGRQVLNFDNIPESLEIVS